MTEEYIHEDPVCKDVQESTERWDEIWDATPGCNGKIVSAGMGGVKCTKCKGWCCY